MVHSSQGTTGFQRLGLILTRVANLAQSIALATAITFLLVCGLPCQAQDYPLAVGTQWTLHMRQELGQGVHFSEEDAAFAKDGILDTTVVSRVASIDPLNGSKYFHVESRRNGKLWLEEWLQLAPVGLLLARSIDHSSGEEVAMLPPQRWLSPTLSPGESWNWKQTAAPVSSRTTVGTTEKTVVAAGAYDAVRVSTETTFETEGQPLKVLQVRWFVPGVGYVKQETRVEIAGHLLTHTLLTLEKFERARAR